MFLKKTEEIEVYSNVSPLYKYQKLSIFKHIKSFRQLYSYILQNEIFQIFLKKQNKFKAK